MTTVAPARIEPLLGSLLDCDAHLYLEPGVMAEIVGDAGGGWIIDYLRSYAGSDEDLAARARAHDEPWSIKGFSALGAFDAAARLEAMDAMGIRAQLLFPNTALRELRMDTRAAREACRRYNDYSIEWTARTGDRARAVCQINMSDAAWAIAELERVLGNGARGVLLPCATPPAGTSPANELWDPLWRMLEAADTPAFLHVGAGGLVSSAPPDPMFPPREFADAASLRARVPDRPGAEERIGPFFFTIAHVAAEVWLVSMVMGGVFERFPGLRFGVIEFGASWVGPMCERLELHAELLAKVGVSYPLRPSEYVRRNVRVTPFWLEPVGELVERHGLREVYVFNTDFPHVEGGRDPLTKFTASTARLTPPYDRAFFVDNARLLFPGLS
jgi:uncharacterized protein